MQEDYEDGDKVRVLPCRHRFHMGCVDQWLGGRRACPVCKHDAGRGLGEPAAHGRENTTGAGVMAGLAGGGGGGPMPAVANANAAARGTSGRCAHFDNLLVLTLCTRLERSP